MMLTNLFTILGCSKDVQKIPSDYFERQRRYFMNDESEQSGDDELWQEILEEERNEQSEYHSSISNGNKKTLANSKCLQQF